MTFSFPAMPFDNNKSIQPLRINRSADESDTLIGHLSHTLIESLKNTIGPLTECASKWDDSWWTCVTNQSCSASPFILNCPFTFMASHRVGIRPQSSRDGYSKWFASFGVFTWISISIILNLKLHAPVSSALEVYDKSQAQQIFHLMPAQ